VLEPAFGELSDAMADLEANFMHLQLLHESLGRFNENFAAFLYGMNMSAFCVDFSEAPVPQSFTANPGGYDQMAESPFLMQQQQQQQQQMDATFLTSDTSFVENPPPTSVKKSGGKFSSVPGSAAKSAGGVGRGTVGRGRAGSGIARGTSSGRGRGTDRGRAGSGIGRGIPRGRGVR
jgi:DASH complex subunit DAM1